MKNAMFFPVVIGLWLACGIAQAEEKFEKVQVYFEQNVDDKDAEVKFEAISGNAGMVALKITAPDGRTVVDFKAPDSALGIRHLILESPEPKNDGRVQKDFPAGVYKFNGTAAGGAQFQDQATLSHRLPAPASLVRPKPDEKNVPVKGLTLSWTAGKDLSAIMLVVEHEKSGRAIRANLAGNATTFAVPDGFLMPGTEYKVAVGTVLKDGNGSFTESTMTTVAQAGGSAKGAPAAAAKTISEDQAKEIALKAVPGKVTDIAIEKKFGANRYVVEVMPTTGGKELDVIIDMTSGKVLKVEK